MEKNTHPANRLKSEKSPYLRQHAFNPVDWYPWGEEALQKAKREDKPVILSIGYSTCHWCHVMERESFEDAETSGIMNENFICIKVDREERPDLDSLYMKAVQAMTGHAGWPLTVFMTPDGVPFYGGAYFPPDDRFGLPSFKKVLSAASRTYKSDKKRIGMARRDIEEALSSAVAEKIALEPGIAENAYDAARLFFDTVNGGFGRGTKFPHAMFLKFLLKYYRRSRAGAALGMVKKTLSAMGAGGIYDHLGGGFHRYSVDERWDIPHFEKMLYDNALLSMLYALAYDETGMEPYKEVAIETLDCMLHDMRDGGGGFYSAQDADVEGREGEYYLWGYEEIEKVLGKDDAAKLFGYFTVTKEGNYEGKNVLRIGGVEKGSALPKEEINRLKKALLDIRRKRTPPETDRKIISAWNGLAVSALVQASGSFKRADYFEEAKRCARFILSSVKDENGRLLRYYLEGRSQVKGILEDYGLFAGGILSIYEAGGEAEWLEEARRLTDAMIELFYDEAEGVFFDAGKDQERLFVRERDLFDNDIPSGNSAAADLLLRMSLVTGDKKYRERADEILGTVEGIRDEPLSYGNFLCVLESALGAKEPLKH